MRTPSGTLCFCPTPVVERIRTSQLFLSRFEKLKSRDLQIVHARGKMFILPLVLSRELHTAGTAGQSAKLCKRIKTVMTLVAYFDPFTPKSDRLQIPLQHHNISLHNMENFEFSLFR